ncbi:hypothetical protein KP509_06G074200 [Ceratopteris richardii]|uniref:4-coumarate--CoA ligase n=1 Tax=Ceratopteris richardii TaxID=49495 RepID=A0A8T2UJQ1_CERRI|nr:hypothetical protein KP509_06G074200 [Ceratopteris richardii]
MPPSHIGHALSRLAVERADAPVCISDGSVRTGAQLVERILGLASGLRVNLGLQCGDRVAIAAFNSDQYLEWLIAVPCAGGIIAPLNYRWSIQEAYEAILQIKPVLLVVDHYCSDFGVKIQHRLPSLQLIALGCSIHGAPQANSILHRTENFRLHWAPDNIALICFTSGTTGKPKGAAISHNAIVFQSMAKITMVNYSQSDVYLHASPLCHIGGISSAHALLLVGGSHVFLSKFNALNTIEMIKKHQVTAIIAVPTMLKDLTTVLCSSRYNDMQLYSVRTILNGAGSLSLDVLQKTAKYFPAAKILSAYGMTEACSSMSFITLHDPNLCKDGQHLSEFKPIMREHHSSQLGGFCVGKAAPHLEIIVSANQDKACPRGCVNEEGDVLVRGPNMMEKYWGDVENAFDDYGWFSTGDVGWMDHMGQLWLLGRRKDVIKSGGENVHCYEIEEILSRHPAIAAAAVAGIPDVRLGEIVGAMVLIRDDWEWDEHPKQDDSRLAAGSRRCSSHISSCNDMLDQKIVSQESLQQFCIHQGLSRFKIPKVWCQKIGAFTTTSTGKVRKDLVRKELIDYMNSQSVLQPIEEFTVSKL